jgi:hypothetical protein
MWREQLRVNTRILLVQLVQQMAARETPLRRIW